MICYFAVPLKLVIWSSSELWIAFPEINLVFLAFSPCYSSFIVKWPGELGSTDYNLSYFDLILWQTSNISPNSRLGRATACHKSRSNYNVRYYSSTTMFAGLCFQWKWRSVPSDMLWSLCCMMQCFTPTAKQGVTLPTGSLSCGNVATNTAWLYR
jgi:hypothetical protein